METYLDTLYLSLNFVNRRKEKVQQPLYSIRFIEHPAVRLAVMEDMYFAVLLKHLAHWKWKFHTHTHQTRLLVKNPFLGTYQSEVQRDILHFLEVYLKKKDIGCFAVQLFSLYFPLFCSQDILTLWYFNILILLSSAAY